MDRKGDIIDALEIMRKKEIADKQPYKARAYAVVIKELKNHGPIVTIKDVDDVKGVGVRIKEKIQEIINTGKLHQAEEYGNRDNVRVINDLLKVYGIGPAKARQLVDEHGIVSIEQLNDKKELLNEKQLIGLKHWEDFELRIPRTEMDKHNAYIKTVIAKIDKSYVAELTGSYRRKLKDSGDIDVLITHPDDKLDHEANFIRIIDLFKKEGYITDILAQGGKKCLAVCKAKRYKHYRRIDFMFTQKHEFPFALLYFTGSGDFNVEMRNIALQKGYSLSEYGLKCLGGPREGDYVNANFEKEEDVFKFLGLDYVAPDKRLSGVLY